MPFEQMMVEIEDTLLAGFAAQDHKQYSFRIRPRYLIVNKPALHYAPLFRINSFT